MDDLVFISASYGTGAALLRVGQKGPEKLWSSDEALSKTLGQLRPYSVMLVAGGDEEYIENMLVALRA